MGKNNRNPDLVCENMSSSDIDSHSMNSKFDSAFCACGIS